MLVGDFVIFHVQAVDNSI